MASSNSTSVQATGLAKTRDRRQRVDLQRIQNVLAIWLDSSADDDTDDCRHTVAQLRHVINDVNTYVDGEQCIQFIQTIKDNKVCMVISGALGQHIVPSVHGLPQVDAIFIFCGNKKYHEQWAKGWPKIKGVFTEITPICGALRQAAQQCEQNATAISFVTSDATGDRLDPSFMYTQILKEILLTIDFSDQHIREYVEYCRETLKDNDKELTNIRQLKRHYREKTPIWWYTCETFLYPMLNKALRTMDGDIIVRMGFFINDLHRHIEREHQRQYASHGSSATFTVYRGQGLSRADFEQLMKNKSGLMSFNCFLSTSKNRSVSLGFAQGAANNPDLVGVLFEMKIDPSQSTTSFASIHDLSAIQGEDEVLFAMNSVFRVHDAKAMDGNSQLYEVYLSLTSDNDPQLRKLTDRIREESFPNSAGWYRLACSLHNMGQQQQAEDICQSLLQQEANEDDKGHLYNLLALIKDDQSEYEEALIFYHKDLAISEKLLPPNHPNLATSYNNVANVYNSMGDYPKALASYEKALTILQQSLLPTHPSLAKSYNNIGVVYDSMGDYAKALTLYERALAIEQQSLPSTHPSLAASYNNIGSVYNDMGDYPKALASYENALAIQQQSLPPTHPSLAISYNNIGVGYSRVGDYPKALASYEKALAIQQQSLHSTHPSLAAAYNNIGMVYNNMGDYPKALASFEKALAIQQQSLPPTHPSLAISYNNIGMVYNSMGDYPKALASFEKALAIRQQSLPPTHPDLASSYNNIGVVYDSMGDYAKALTLYEKSLAIRQQSIPPTHPDLAMSYNNNGEAHRSMEDYPKALTLNEEDLGSQQESFSPTHPDLTTTYGSLYLLGENIGSFSEALSFPVGTVKMVEQSAPSKHHFLHRWRKHLERIKRKL